MSYIRCTSNPESLYIYDTSGGITSICRGRAKSNQRQKPTIDVKTRDWRGLLANARRNRHLETHRYGTLKVSEMYVLNGRLRKTFPDINTLFSSAESYSQKVLSGTDIHGVPFRVPMWEVTWDYIVRNNS